MLFVATITTGARGAWAQQAVAPSPSSDAPPTSASLEPARLEFEQGLAALRDDRFGDAVVLFERSYQRRRVASVALNLGLALRGVGRFVEARARLQEFLELASPPQHERYDREVVAHLADLARRTGVLRIAVAPEGVTLRINGRRVSLDREGVLRVDPGRYAIDASLDGYLSETWPVDVASGAELSHRFELVRAVPAASVVIAPAGSGAAASPRVSTSPSRAWVWAVVGSVAAAAVVTTVLAVALAPAPTPYDLPRDRVFEALEVAR